MRLPIKELHKMIAAVLLLACISQVSARLAVMSIDLGGEYMKIAIVKPGVPMEIALNKDSGRKTLTMVAFRDGERQFSNQAQSTAVKFPPKSISYINHVMGREFDDPQVQLYQQRFPYINLVKDEERGTVLFKLEEVTYSPEELLGMIMEKAREYAQDFAEQDIKDAVITVPSFYNQAERRSVMQAASLVGINVLQLMNDNSAVALNYGVFRRKNFNTTMQYYMFYDMGATSTTATVVGYNVVKTKEGGYMESNPQLTVKGVGFDRTLGGLEFTLRLRNHLAKVFDGKKKTSMKATENNRAMAKLFKESERVKKVLSANTDHAAQIENLLDEQDFHTMVSRAELEEMSSDLFTRVTKPVEEALKVSEITLPEISEVILMGAATRMPKVQELLTKFVGKSELGKSINTDEAAAMGAVYQAAYLGKGFKVKKFGVRDGNIYPISVEFEKQILAETASTNTEPPKVIKRMLFGRMNPYPQKKVMTFNRHTSDFGFKVIYSDMDFMTENDRKSFGTHQISEYTLEGVGDALEKNKDSESKGIKAHFRMDESGLLSLEKVESVFEKNTTADAPEKSAWSKIGRAIGDLFGSSAGDEETKVEEFTEEEQSSDEDSKETVDAESDAGNGEKTGDDKKKNEEEGSDGKAKEEEKNAKKEDKEKSDEEGKKESAEKESDKTADEKKTADNNSTSKNDTKKDSPPKVTTVKEEIKSQQEVKDVPDMSKDALKKAKKRLSDLRNADKEKAEMEKAKNELESFIFDFQDKLSDEDSSYYKCASDDEKAKLNEQLSETSDWLYEQGDDTKKSDYTAKLKSLTDANKPVVKRVFEMEERPKALEALKSILNQTNIFLETVKNMSDLEDPIFTQVELDTLEKLINESRDWRDKYVADQKKLKPYEDPVLMAEDIALKISALDREMRYLINKAKNYKPKPKPKEESKSNETKTSKDNDTTTTTKKSTESSQEDAPPTEEKEHKETKEDKKEEKNEGKKRRPKSKRKEEELKEDGEEILELDAASDDSKDEDTTTDKKTEDDSGTTKKEEHQEL